MTIGSTTLRVIQPLQLRAPSVGTPATPDLRAARGLAADEPLGLAFLHPAGNHTPVTGSGRVYLGVFDVERLSGSAPSVFPRGMPWDCFTRDPKIASLKGESTIFRAVYGTEETGIADESGRVMVGVDAQILHIRSLDHMAVGHLERDEITVANGVIGALRSAVRQLQTDMPTLEKAVNGVAANLRDEHSPVLQSVAQTIVDELRALQANLEQIDIDTVDYPQLAAIFDHYAWRHTVQYRDDAEKDSRARDLPYRASRFLAGTALSILEVLTRHGRLVRLDEHGHGVTLEFPIEGECWTSDHTFTRAEFSTLLRLLGWSATTSQAQVTKSVRTKDGKTVMMQPHGMVCETRTRQMPFVRVHLNFSQVPAETI